MGEGGGGRGERGMLLFLQCFCGIYLYDCKFKWTHRNAIPLKPRRSAALNQKVTGTAMATKSS